MIHIAATSFQYTGERLMEDSTDLAAAVVSVQAQHESE